MPIPLRVLLLEDNSADAELMIHELRRGGFDPHWQRVDTEDAFRGALEPGLDVILSNFTLPTFDGRRALKIVQERELHVPFIIVSGTIGEELAIACMRHGAADYLVMPGMSGPQLAALLTGGERPMKELYMSGYLDDAVIRHGINETGLVFLHKPLTPDSLLRKVREVLDEEMPAAEEADGGVV